jgi:cell shape-determining protein MreD
MIPDVVKLAVAVFLLAVLQVSAMPQLVPGNAGPDLLLILVVMVALLRGAEAAALTGFAAGLLLDAMVVGRLGLTSLLYIGAGLWIALRVDPADQVVPTGPQVPRPPIQFAYVVAAVGLMQVALAMAHVLLGDNYPVRYELSNVIVPTIVDTAVAALVLLPLLRRLLPYRSRVDGYPVTAL